MSCKISFDKQITTFKFGGNNKTSIEFLTYNEEQLSIAINRFCDTHKEINSFIIINPETHQVECFKKLMPKFEFSFTVLRL